MNMEINTFHLYGLPVGENTKCTIALTDEGISVKGEGYQSEIPFIRVATCEFDGPDVICDDRMVGFISVMAGGLVAKMEEADFRKLYGLTEDAALPEDVTLLILNYLDGDGTAKSALLLENPCVSGATIIDLVFAYRENKPAAALKPEYVEKAEKVEVK